MGLKFKDLSKSNKITYVLFWTVSALCFLDMFIQFNIWIFFIGIMFALKTLDVKSEQKSIYLIEGYSNLSDKQVEEIKKLTLKLQESEEKIKKLTLEAQKFQETIKETETKKTAKKTTTKKTTTAKKPVKKEAKKDGTK